MVVMSAFGLLQSLFGRLRAGDNVMRSQGHPQSKQTRRDQLACFMLEGDCGGDIKAILPAGNDRGVQLAGHVTASGPHRRQLRLVGTSTPTAPTTAWCGAVILLAGIGLVWWVFAHYRRRRHRQQQADDGATVHGLASTPATPPPSRAALEEAPTISPFFPVTALTPLALRLTESLRDFAHEHGRCLLYAPGLIVRLEHVATAGCYRLRLTASNVYTGVRLPHGVELELPADGLFDFSKGAAATLLNSLRLRTAAAGTRRLCGEQRIREIITDGIGAVRQALGEVSRRLPQDEHTQREYARRFLETTGDGGGSMIARSPDRSQGQMALTFDSAANPGDVDGTIRTEGQASPDEMRRVGGKVGELQQFFAEQVGRLGGLAGTLAQHTVRVASEELDRAGGLTGAALQAGQGALWTARHPIDAIGMAADTGRMIYGLELSLGDLLAAARAGERARNIVAG